jgi:hypothetical protein
MNVELHMLPVPAGDCSLIIDRSTGKQYTVLIDAGLARKQVVAYLQSIGVYHLDLVVISHPDLDHLQGLLELIDDPSMSISSLWCFDLAFLREFVTTGKLPKPKEGTHGIRYVRFLFALRSHDRLLRHASAKGITAYQVSEGYRFNLGNLHIEVLYPWDGFYAALRSPESINQLLAKRWPLDWVPRDHFREEGAGQSPSQPRRLTVPEQQDVLEKLLEGLQEPESASECMPPIVADTEYADGQETIYVRDVDYVELNVLPVQLLGTLYNNLSIVLRIHVLGGLDPPRILFPGDLTDWTYLIARHPNDLLAHVFKYPHHGSAGVTVMWPNLAKHGYPNLTPCPCCPRYMKDCRNWHREFWYGVEAYVPKSGRMHKDFASLVHPEHTLVFPYPSQGLPKPDVISRGLGQILANRHDLDPKHLADPSNLAVPRVLEIGGESSDIRLLP